MSRDLLPRRLRFWAAPKLGYVECALLGANVGTLFFKLACKSLCSFQGLGILFYLDLRLALLWHQKAFMTVKTRNEKYRPGISEAASCQAFRGSSGGRQHAEVFCLISPISQRFLIKLRCRNRSNLLSEEDRLKDARIRGDFHIPQ